MQGIAANPKRKGEVVDQFINIALALEEVRILVIDVPDFVRAVFRIEIGPRTFC